MRDWSSSTRWSRFPRRSASSLYREPRRGFGLRWFGGWNLRGRIKESSAGFQGDRLRTIGKALIAVVIVADAGVLAYVLTRNETPAIDRDRQVRFESAEEGGAFALPSMSADTGADVGGTQVENQPKGDGKAGGKDKDRQGNDRRDGPNDGDGNASGGGPAGTGSDGGSTDGGSSTGGTTDSGGSTGDSGGSTGDSGGSTGGDSGGSTGGDSGGSGGDSGGSGGDSGGSGGDSGGTEEPSPAPEPGPGGGGPGGGGDDGGSGGGGDSGGGGGGGGGG